MVSQRTVKGDELPAWVRALLSGDRAVGIAHRAELALVGRALWTFLDPGRRYQVTAAMYGRQHQYLPGAPLHEQGLFDWEREAVTTPPFPAQGRLLLGGAGGGRELLGLCRLGHSVAAFEPSPQLVDGARAVARQYPDAEVASGSYEDLIRHVGGESTPLEHLLARRFDGIILGWGSLSHVLDRDAQLRLLRAFRKLAPGAPVLASYSVRVPPSDRSEGQRGAGLRHRALPLLRRIGTVSPGVTFSPSYGFLYNFQPGEIDGLAHASGYAIVRSDARMFPHAVLAPAGGADGTSRA